MISFVVLASCKKKGATPTPETPVSRVVAEGSLSGVITPVASITRVVITSLATAEAKSVNVDPSKGSFSMKGLSAGSYTLDYIETDFFVKPAQTKVTVKADQNTEVGTISATERVAPISCYVNGEYQGWIRKGYYSNKLLQLVNYTIPSSGPNGNGLETKYDLDITFRNFNGVGTYVCDNTKDTEITYSLYRGGLLQSRQSTETQGNIGTVTITSFDPVEKTIKGTFTATLAARSQSSNDGRAITKGIINASF